MDDKVVIEGIKYRSDETLAELYKSYRTEFISWLIKNYRCSMEEAKEAFQSSVITLYENVIHGKLTTLNSSIKTYLFAIGKNKLSELRKASQRYTDFESTSNNPVWETGDYQANEMDLRRVEKSLGMLGEPCKTLLELYYYKKSSMPEIAEVLQYKNADTAKNLKYKCLQRLRKIFEKEALEMANN